jgi:hypothetical protein
MQNKTEQMAVPSEFRLFRRREKPRNSVPNHFLEEKNPRNSVLNHFSEEKNLGILYQTISWKRKTLGIPFWTISRKRKTHGIPFWTIFGWEKPRNSVPNHFRKGKNLGIPFWIIFVREKTSEKTTFVSCFVTSLFCRIPFRFVPGYRMDSSETLRITRNEHFTLRNNENRVSGHNTSGRQDSPVMNTFGSLDSWTVCHQKVFL